MLFAFEDRRFYSHFGVDPFGIARAARDLVLKQRIVTGGSTLTMQVARLLDNQYKRTPSVKLRQIVRALQLEQQLTKKQILSLYLGLAPFGGRVKGVRAASLKYFGKEPHNLSIAEAALLVALPQAPEARRLDRDAEAALRARNFVLKTVTAAGVLTPEEAQRAQLEPVVAASPPMPPTPEMKPVLKPATANVAGLFAGITIGLNLVAGPATAAPIEPPAPPQFMASASAAAALGAAQAARAAPRGHDARRSRRPLDVLRRADRAGVGQRRRVGRRKRWRSSTRLKRAGDWGLDAADFEVPALPSLMPDAAQSEKALADAEMALSLAALKYARYARGGRIEDPATQLSSYLDRKPTLRHPLLVMNQIAASAAPGEYLQKMHPQHPQFEKLRQQYLARRDGATPHTVGHPDQRQQALSGHDAPGHSARPRAARRCRDRRRHRRL